MSRLQTSGTAASESGTIRFDQPGEFEYVCTYHAQTMKGKVIVSD